MMCLAGLFMLFNFSRVGRLRSQIIAALRATYPLRKLLTQIMRWLALTLGVQCFRLILWVG